MLNDADFDAALATLVARAHSARCAQRALLAHALALLPATDAAWPHAAKAFLAAHEPERAGA